METWRFGHLQKIIHVNPLTTRINVADVNMYEFQDMKELNIAAMFDQYFFWSPNVTASKISINQYVMIDVNNQHLVGWENARNSFTFQ